MNGEEVAKHRKTLVSISVVSHEVGHATAFIDWWNVIRITKFGWVSSFSAAVAFQLITLLVKFNASSRAKSQIIYDGIIRNGEERGVNKVL